MKNKSRFIVLCVLAFSITALSWFLGCLMYNTNLRATYHNLVSVEYTDFIENIRYGMHFGKELKTFYGMDETLNEELSSHEDTKALYVISKSDGVLFMTDGKGFPISDVNTSQPGLTVLKNLQYDVLNINDESVLAIEKESFKLNTDLKNSYIRLLVVAVTGLLILFLVMLCISSFISKENISYKIMVTALAVWITAFSAFLGVSNYRDYASSIGQIDASIETSVKHDWKIIKNYDINKKYVGDVDDYLKRFSDNIPEIESVTYEDGKDLVIDNNDTYLNHMAIDYVLQTILFLVFSAIILTEYQMFISGIEEDKTEGFTHE